MSDLYYAIIIQVIEDTKLTKAWLTSLKKTHKLIRILIKDIKMYHNYLIKI